MKLLFLFFAMLPFFISAKSQDSRTAPLTEIIKRVSNSWLDVQQQNQTGIKLESVTASFSLSKTTSKGGEIKIWIFKLGSKTERTKIHKVTLELARPEKDRVARKNNDSAKELTDFIKSTLSDFKKLNDMGILPDLSKRTITLEVGLTITKSKGAGGEYEIGIFTLSAEAGKNSEQGNTLTLVFSKE